MTYADRIPAPRPVPTTRQRMTDAPGCGHTPEQHRHDDGQNADDRSADRAIRELTAERDRERARADRTDEALLDARYTIDQVLSDKNAALARVERLARDLDSTQQVATFRQGVINLHTAELGAAGEVLAVVRDAHERIERALARYDTAPEVTPVEPAPRHPGDALADALRNAYTTEQLAELHEELVHTLDDDAPREDPLGRLVDALFSARWHKPQPPSLGSVSPRAQDQPTAADLLRQAAAGRREYAKLMPEKAEPLDLQAHTLDAAALVVEGDLSPLYDWLPSWQWTGEMNARLHPTAAAMAERTPRPLPAGWHVTRGCGPSDLEADCPCPKEPCGGVDTRRADPACEQHPAARARTMRQMHRADQCPGKREG